MNRPIDLSLLFSSARGVPTAQRPPLTGFIASAADRIAMPLDLRNSIEPVSRCELARLS